MIKFFKRFRMPLAVLIISAAVVSSLFRALTPWATQYKGDIEQHLSAILGESVTIQSMETGWYWFDPVIKLKEIAVGNEPNSALHLKKLLVGINVVSSLWHWRIEPGVLYIDDLHLTLRQTKQSWQIDGLHQNDTTLDYEAIKPILSWILSQRKITVKHFSSNIIFANGRIIPLDALNLKIVRHSNQYRIRVNASLAQNTATNLELLANLTLPGLAWDKSQGQAYIAINDIDLKQWQSLLPFSVLNTLAGQSQLKLWVDWSKGQLQKIQGQVAAKQLSLLSPNAQLQQIPEFQANLAWLKNKAGWQLLADHIVLKNQGLTWPENNLSLNYEQATQTYKAYINRLDISPLLNLLSNWTDKVKAFKQAQFVGQLSDIQFHYQEGKVVYLLSRFSDLGWRNIKKWPSVNHLSGVAYWQPTEGKLEIDSENSQVSLERKPPVLLNTLNADIAWKALNNGLHVSVNRLIIQRPDLILNTHGTLDGVSEGAFDQLDLTTDLSAQQAHKWIQYLPAHKLKPKLAHWLNKDIKKIGSVTAEMRIQGKWADFPFDATPGKFEIYSHLQDVNLLFAPGWPLTKNIEAYLTFNKRDLNADIVQARLNNIPIKQANLRINDIGHDRENLLVHGQAETDAKLALAYVKTSPLIHKLSILSMLDTQGPLNLDLQLQVPLYPEDDTVLALGNINFINNHVDIKHGLTDVVLNAVNGSLQFNQEGILESQLKTIIMDYPVSILMKSVTVPDAGVEVTMAGKTTVNFLKEKVNLPALDFMKGDLWINSRLLLTNNPNDLDRLKVSSSLEGVTIDLPEPLGKKANDSVPLVLDIAFNPSKALEINAKYGDRLTSQLWFAGNKGELQLEKGLITLGQSKSTTIKETGIQLRGNLSAFDWQAWQTALGKVPSTGHNSLVQALHSVDLSIKKIAIAGQNFNNLNLKAAKNSANEWLIALRQPAVTADLVYEPKLNRLKGTIKNLALRQNLNSHSAKTKYDVKDMPNLDLVINNLQINQLNLGNAIIQASGNGSKWNLTNFVLQSPYYVVNAKGQWQQTARQNQSNLQGTVKITNLAKSLEQFKITPVVEAKRGTIQFQGEWPASFFDFTLNKVNGLMSMRFRNGRITHLNKETEEKLGLGKLLSILSLQTIPRRLMLDFSDLSQDGYSFDVFEGSFKVNHGLVTTQDSYIDGPIAYASMKGNLDITKQLYNLDLQVNPHITASLPIVATIAGGPIAGIATWVASKIINRGMQRISGYTYHISGPWQQPLVQQVSIIKHKKDH